MRRIIQLLFVFGVLTTKAQLLNCDVSSNVNDICPGDDVTLTYTFTNPTDYAVEFNGVSQTINIAHNNALSFPATTNFTIEFWFYAFGATNNGTLLTKADVTGIGYSIGLSNSNLTCVISDGGTPVVVADATTIQSNQWYHVAIVFDRQNFCTIYLDGVVNAGGQVSIAALNDITNTEPIGVGGPAPSLVGVLPYFNGVIDEIRIWNRALPSGEIVGRSTTHINPDAQNGLAGYWDLNDGTGVMAMDCSTTGEHGTLMNNASFVTNTPALAWNFGITWSTGDFGPTIIVLPTDTTTYIASAGYCRYECIDSVIVNVLDCDTVESDFEITSVWIPSSFTPNGDNINDLFTIKGSFVYDYEIMIYNRFGNIMYHSKDMSNSWDGKFEGDRVKDGTYSYVVSYRDRLGEQQKKYGYVLVSY